MDTESDVSTWELRRGDVVLANLTEYDQDFPWIYCRFEEADAFEPFRHYFIRGNSRSRDQIEELHQEIQREGIHLLTTEGQPVLAFTLHLMEKEARLTFAGV